MTSGLEALLGDGPIDARALAAQPIAIVQRMLARRIAAVGGRDEARIGLEKIEALASLLRGAAAEGRALTANVGGTLVRLTAKGRLAFAPEPARRGRSAGHRSAARASALHRPPAGLAPPRRGGGERGKGSSPAEPLRRATRSVVAEVEASNADRPPGSGPV